MGFRKTVLIVPLIAALSVVSVAPADASIQTTRDTITSVIDARLAVLEAEIADYRAIYNDPNTTPTERAAAHAAHGMACARFLRLRAHLRRIPRMTLVRLERLAEYLGIVISPA